MGITVLTPRTLDDALRMREQHPDAVALQGGTDVMVELNFDRARPERILDLSRVPELRGWTRTEGELRLGSALTFTEAMSGRLADAVPAFAQAARTVGSPQIRNRGTLGGNLGTASPAGDALPPLLAESAAVELASVRGRRSVDLERFLVAPRRTAAAPDELIVSVRLRPSGAPQTFMKVGPRNAMAIAVASVALVADRGRGEVRVAFGSAAPTVRRVTARLKEAGSLPDRVEAACAPIDDVRGSAAHRRHVLRVMTARALERCLP